MFPDLTGPDRHPRLEAWRERVADRPALQDALAMPDHTNPALRTFTGDVH